MPAPTKVAESKTRKSPRWPDELRLPGQWIELPKVLINRSSKLKLEPHHV